jgi:hypothetical protein
MEMHCVFFAVGTEFFIYYLDELQLQGVSISAIQSTKFNHFHNNYMEKFSTVICTLHFI